MFKYSISNGSVEVVDDDEDTSTNQRRLYKAVREHNTLISNQAKTISHCCAAKDGKLCGAGSIVLPASQPASDIQH